MSARYVSLPQRSRAGDVVCSVAGATVLRGHRAILDNVTLEVRAGEVLALLGPNGAGKSTLLSALSGDLAVASGSVQFAGKEITDWSLGDLARRRSVLLQDHQLLFPFTVHEVVEMGRAPWRRTPAEQEDDEAIIAAIAASDIAHLTARRVPSLSGGERARTAFARVIAGRTGMLMLDEPTAALDLKHQEAVLRFAKERAEAGDAVLVVLHDLNLAGAYAGRIALMRNGRVHVCDTPEKVLTAATVAEVYQTPVEVIQHPETGRGIVLPLRP